MPICPATGKAASATDPLSWAGLGEAQEAVARDRLTGLGFVLNGDGVVGLDLDSCRCSATGAIAPWATKIIKALRSYAEVSPSGTGVKILCRADPVPQLAANKRTIGKANGAKPPVSSSTPLAGTSASPATSSTTFPTRSSTPRPSLNASRTGSRRRSPRPELPAAFLALLEHDAELRDAWEHGTKLGPGGDKSASGLDWSLAKYLRTHLSDADLEAVLRCYSFGQIGSGKLKGKAADRRIAGIIAELGERPKPEADEPHEPAEPTATQPWPEPLEAEAYHGIVGEIVAQAGTGDRGRSGCAPVPAAGRPGQHHGPRRLCQG